MRKGVTPFLIGLLWLFNSSCDPPGDERMHVINNSKDTLGFYYTTTYPLPSKNPFNNEKGVIGELPYTSDGSLNGRILLPYENKIVGTGTGKWDPVIANPYSDSTITFFTFSLQTIRTVPWDTIIQRKLYKSHKFTWDQIQSSNWQLRITPKL